MCEAYAGAHLGVAQSAESGGQRNVSKAARFRQTELKILTMSTSRPCAPKPASCSNGLDCSTMVADRVGAHSSIAYAWLSVVPGVGAHLVGIVESLRNMAIVGRNLQLNY